MVKHDYNRRAQDKRMGKDIVYLLLIIAVTNALFIMPVFYILK